MRAALVVGLLALVVPSGAAAQILSPGKLAAAHAELEGIRQCTACHELGKRGIAPDRCLSCHVPLRERIEAGRGYHATVSSDCADCHQDHLGPDFDLRRLDEATFEHRDTGYPLQLSHASADCRDCHRADLVVDPGVVRALENPGALDHTFLGVATTCASCHGDVDPHDGQFAGQSCADCHDTGEWTDPVRFDHVRARFPLEGLHAQVDCASCHVPRAGASVPYRGVAFESCSDCHDDPHAGAMSGTCASCHSPRGWGVMASGALEGRFDHGTTAFPLVGAHAAAECVACHRTGSPPVSELIRMRYRPGTAGATYPKPVADSCGSCHVDTHALSGSEGRWTDCASCHSEARWAPSDYGVARHAASVFPLTGAHEVTPCYACHLEPDRGHARFTLGLDAASCAACHAEESPHGDLYPDQPCASCHVTEAFDVVSFDHTGIDTGPESGACATCHQADDPHRDQFPDRSCAACHGTESFRPLDRPFAHEATAFPLDGAHAEVACLSCHRTEQDAEGPFVRYRPLGTECVDCHGGDQ